MIVKLLTEHHLEFLSLKGGCRGLSESTHVKIQHCWKSHALALLSLYIHVRILRIMPSSASASVQCSAFQRRRTGREH